jgi:hypothetical protein
MIFARWFTKPNVVNRDLESNGSEICFLCVARTQFSPLGASRGMFDVRLPPQALAAPLHCRRKAAYLGHHRAVACIF